MSATSESAVERQLRAVFVLEPGQSHGKVEGEKDSKRDFPVGQHLSIVVVAKCSAMPPNGRPYFKVALTADISIFQLHDKLIVNKSANLFIPVV